MKKYLRSAFIFTIAAAITNVSKSGPLVSKPEEKETTYGIEELSQALDNISKSTFNRFFVKINVTPDNTETFACRYSNPENKSSNQKDIRIQLLKLCSLREDPTHKNHTYHLSLPNLDSQQPEEKKRMLIEILNHAAEHVRHCQGTDSNECSDQNEQITFTEKPLTGTIVHLEPDQELVLT